MEIKYTELFKGVEQSDCKRMLKCFNAEEKQYNSGEKVCVFKDMDSQIGIILRGSVNIIRSDINGNISLLEHLEENDLFGKYFSYSSSYDDCVEVVCECACSIVFIGNEHLLKRCSNACDCHTVIVQNMFEIITKRSQELSEHLIVLSNRTIRGKLLCYFEFLKSRSGRNMFKLPFTTTALAEYLCVDRSAMMRELKKMREEGIVEIEKRNVTMK